MAVDVSKTEYLKRYLEKDDKKAKRKKKHKQNPLIPRVKIVDKNIDLKSIKFGEKEVDEEDEAPIIADIIDERPEEVKIKEIYESSRWKKLDSVAGESTCDADNEPIKSHLHDKQLKTRDNLKESKKEISATFNKRRHNSDSDNSPSRMHDQKIQIKNRHDSDSDASISPNPLISVQSNRRHDSDSDNSSLKRQSGDHETLHPKDSKKSYHKKHLGIDKSEGNTQNKSRKYDSDSDLSPERLSSRRSPSVQKSHKPRKVTKNSDSDLSPERKSNKRPHSVKNSKSSKLMYNSDSDLSPPRGTGSLKEYGDSSVKGDKRPGKTLSGLKAGLQNAATLREETHELRLREKKQINELDSELSGKNADTVVRDRRTGKIRDLEEENRDKEAKEKRNSEQLKKYSEWGKGIEQTENKKAKLNEDLYEMAKPLARYCDDEDLEDRLKSIIYDDDPMSEYIKKKRRKDAVSSMPEYNGPPPPPNRFGMKPGYRWDGVDRSNGFERKYFEKHSSKKCIQEEAYLWSVQNM